ncbi:histidine phosphatase family protein [Bacillus mycoides]|uniref:Histidine phosphatase family protein n=1 Tax=Bacillus mycoides TaxID=1405 RepID=A0A1W6AHK2_BACMY|nr:histidine phosphatase family protein [Bacillus mycoides]ARJ25319.1 hypothetical protein B7492_29930 [Bacillus mycoides]TKI85439.1 hypothetical protein FC701_10035 [Bacillus mycoides]
MFSKKNDNFRILDSLFEEIQAGGYNLYLRHGEKEEEPGDKQKRQECIDQQNLTENGINQSTEIGEIFRKQKLLIQYPVFTSSYCRTKDTGKLAFGEQCEVLEELVNISSLRIENPEGDRKRIKEKLIEMFETIPDSNLNRVFIGHDYSFDQSRNHGLDFLDTVILKPKGQGQGYEFIGIINFEQLKKWSSEKGFK